MKEVSVIVVGYELGITSETPTTVTVYGRIATLNFTSPICSEALFIVDSQPKEPYSISIYGKDLEVQSKTDNTIVIKGDVRRFIVKDSKGKEIKNMIILPCTITLAELLDENDKPM